MLVKEDFVQYTVIMQYKKSGYVGRKPFENKYIYLGVGLYSFVE